MTVNVQTVWIYYGGMASEEPLYQRGCMSKFDYQLDSKIMSQQLFE